jgi:type IV fimbrial biogenesis protein FimT
MTKRSAEQVGFTLVEALLTIVILAVVIGFAAPGMRTLALAQNVKSTSFDLHATLTLARSAALTRNIDVAVTPLADNWASGWVVRDADGVELRRDIRPASVAISGPSALTFSPTGRPHPAGTPFSVSSSELDPSQQRCVRLSLNGRTRATRGACTT